MPTMHNGLLILSVIFCAVAGLQRISTSQPLIRYEWLGVACFFAAQLPV